MHFVYWSEYGTRYSSRRKPPKPWNAARLSITQDLSWLTDKDKNIELRYVLENKSDEDFFIQSGDEVEYEVGLKRQNAYSTMPRDSITINFPLSVPAHTRKLIRVELQKAFKDMKPPENGSVVNQSNSVLKRFLEDYPNIQAIQLRDASQRIILNLPVELSVLDDKRRKAGCPTFARFWLTWGSPFRLRGRSPG